MQEDVQSPGSK